MSRTDRPDRDGDDGSGAAAHLTEYTGLPAAPPKVDPESLVLRGSPRRVARFRREVIIGIAAAALVAVAATAWIALRPDSFKLVGSGEETFDTKNPGSPEALAAVPGSYDQIPKLGPPLPGDLGRPILAHRRKLETEGASGKASGDAEAAARERALADRAAARQSPLFAASEGKPNSSRDENGRQAPRGGAGTDFDAPAMAAAASGKGGDDPSVNPHRIREASSPWIMSAGSLISASLITGINSDLPGTVVAQVTENAFDSITGKTLLIPQGARLIGRYESSIAYGQRRAFISWHRIIWPDGTSLRIEDVPASDISGYSGLADKVDFHGGALLKGVAMSTVLGVGTELGFGDKESDLVRAFRESAQTNDGRAADQIVGRSLDIEPTITVRPGWPVRVLLQTDLVLKPWRS